MYEFSITIDKTKVSGTNTNFPYLFSEGCASIPAGFWAHVADATNGLDIKFYDSDDFTELNREIVYFNPGSSLVEAWVQIPSLGISSNKVIYCQYGGANRANDSAVWSNANAKMVYHLQGNATDSTVNGNNGSVTGATTTTGKFNTGYNFSGTTNKIQNTSPTNIPVGNADRTVSTWVYRSGMNGGDNNIIGWGHWNGTKTVFYVCAETISGKLRLVTYAGDVSSSTVIPTTGWTYIAIAYSGGIASFYVNGVAAGTGSLTSINTTMDAYGIGVGAMPGLNPFLGKIDESRVYSDAKAVGWLLTEYNNQNSPVSFSTASSESVIAQTPIASFTGTPLTGYYPLSVSFTDTSSRSPTSWAWNFGDSVTSTSQNPLHVYASAGTYTVVLTATNAFGSDTKTRTNYITVNTPTADFIASPLSGAIPLLVQFTDASVGSISWDWDFGDGSTHGTTNNPIHSYTVVGLYTVVLSISGGQATKTRTNYITVNIVPSFTANPNPVNAGFLVSFTDTSLGSPTLWDWDFGDGSSHGTGAAVYHAYNTAGSYTVTMTATKDSLSASATKNMTVNVVANFISTSRIGADSLSVSFTDTSLGVPTSWVWDFGDRSASTTQSPTHLYSAPGVYTVILKVFRGSSSSTYTQADYIRIGFTASLTKVAYIEAFSPPPPPPVLVEVATLDIAPPDNFQIMYMTGDLLKFYLTKGIRTYVSSDTSSGFKRPYGPTLIFD